MWFAIGIVAFSRLGRLRLPLAAHVLVADLPGQHRPAGADPGHRHGLDGVQRWVSIAGLQFQFSEISKVLMIAVLAAFLAARGDKLGKL